MIDSFGLKDIPTDSVYKFAAISGLILFILSLILPVFWLSILVNDYSSVLSAEYQALWIESKPYLLHSRILAAQAQIQFDETGPVNAVLERVASRNPDFMKLLLDIAKAEAENSTKYDQLNSRRLFLDNQITIAHWIQLFGGLGAVGGVIISYWGFSYWYKKIQIPSDRLLELQLSELHNKNKDS